MKEFTLEKLTPNELTSSDKLKNWICDKLNPVPDYEYDGVKRMTIPVFDENWEVYRNMEWIADEMEENNREIWICWEEDEESGEITEWWIHW